MYLEGKKKKKADNVYTQHFDCNLILHHSGPRTHREADDGLSSSVSAISVSFMFCETCQKTLNKPLEERDKTFLFLRENCHDARPNFLITRRGGETRGKKNKTLNESPR